MNDRRVMPIPKAVEINPKEKLQRGDSYKFVEMADLVERVTRVRSKEGKEFKGSGARFRDGDTLFARITPCLENRKIAKFMGMHEELGFGSTEFIVFRGRQGVTTTDYAHFLATDPQFIDFAISKMTGSSGRQRVPVDALDHYSISVPSIDNQKCITKVLNDLDDKIDLLREMNRTLEEIARAMFRAWFVDFEPVRAKTAGASSFRGMPQELFETLPDSFQPSEIGDIPAGWSSKPLSELIEVNPARQLKKGFEATYLGMTDVPTSGPTPANWAQRKFTSGMRFENGDTLLARITPCLENGKTALVDFLDTGEIGWGSTEYIVLAPQGSASREFIYCLARSERFREFAIKNMTGTSGRQRVTHESISGYEMVDPGAEVLQVFEHLSKPMFERITANRDEISTLSALRDTLLPKLLSGELEAPSLEALGLEGGE